ncbi:hypothetical protein [Deinococcus puniceus]|uniref:Uncharacterized protein n=1 Tax=Deinococcus puniceus TaxID=1182568 RepID=A0A172T5Y4_9DEIO|nr:hypothetical protein [Deinococcus puniceus]ANE42438.1 hypothetical protein SU48_00185 [Deinococcus puniceus]
MTLKRWVWAAALAAGALGMGQAEPLRVGAVYAAGATLEAPALGVQIEVPPGFRAQLVPSEDAPGVAVLLIRTVGTGSIQLSVLPAAPAGALAAAFPARVRAGQTEATLVSSALAGAVQTGHYTLPNAALSRAALLLPNGTRVMATLAHPAGQEAQILSTLKAALNLAKPTAPAPTLPALWQERLKVAQNNSFVTVGRDKDFAFFGLCANGNFAMTTAEDSFANGVVGQVALTALSDTEAVLKLTQKSGFTTLARVQWGSHEAGRTRMNMELYLATPYIGWLELDTADRFSEQDVTVGLLCL